VIWLAAADHIRMYGYVSHVTDIVSHLPFALLPAVLVEAPGALLPAVLVEAPEDLQAVNGSSPD